ncbi:NAD(P)/FAD-dependent oxidoreductase [uncultured Clostridium sp.]|jgi:pyruvate/2-oxoglutarate dehydrogenase complex dihydrolipoamide dehydrogenase (E3) component|uniref:dihydrolipoyl dehydrogenase family protein n=1 Tax=uncultured Clostridium sp. TaxID=59620 RepID=UPI00260432D9|nr:NAD(P)/FAD-dependent oxidoreductase [uncultured Clostridium sp.]
MKYNFDFIVLGAGSAGLTVASSCFGLGASVLLIEKYKMGGDCLNTGCVPSKAFLRISHAVKNNTDLSEMGINTTTEEIDLKVVMDYVQKSIEKIEPKDSKERFESFGIKVLLGDAKLLSNHEVEINGQVYTSKNIVISTGSRPFIPDIKGLEDIDYLTSENIFKLTTLPKKLLVIGAGPIALELGQGFSNLGSNVHIINKYKRIFTSDDEEVGEYMLERLSKDLTFHMNTEVLSITKVGNEYDVLIRENNNKETIRVNKILLSTGRIPNSENLGLENLGIAMNDKKHINVDLKMKTNIKNIYACGDVTGKFAFTHMAGYEASIVTKNAVLKIPIKANYKKVAWTIFTIPSVTHTGLTEEMAKKEGLFSKKILVNFDNTDRFMIDNEEGFIKIILDKKERVIGATIISSAADELIHSLSILIEMKLKITKFLSIMTPYPMRGNVLKEIAVMKYRESFTPFSRGIIKNFLLKI